MSKVWSKIQTHNLIYGGTFEDAKTSIRAKVFGYMVELAKDRIEYYRSDLYHDALWIDINVNGAMQFDWIARESGTHIGDVVMHVKDDDCVNGARYRFDIRVEGDRKWMLDIYESVPLANVPDTVKCNGYEGIYGLQHDGDTCPVHEHDTAVSTAVQNEDPIQDILDLIVPVSWADRHAALDISECDTAKAIEGCIFHPAPVGGWTTMDSQIDGTIENPTPRSNTITTRKVIDMRDVKEMLEEKLSDLNQKLEELNDAQRELEDAQEIAQRNIDSIEEAINALDLDLEDFYFSVDVSFSE